MNLSKNIKIVRGHAYKDTQNTTNIETSDVDFTGYDGVVFFAWFEKGTDASDENFLKVQQKDSDGSYNDLEGAKVEVEEDGKVAAVDVYRPLESQGKELRGVADISNASKTGDVYAVLYNGRVKPEEFADYAKLAISPEESD